MSIMDLQMTRRILTCVLMKETHVMKLSDIVPEAHGHCGLSLQWIYFGKEDDWGAAEDRSDQVVVYSQKLSSDRSNGTGAESFCSKLQQPGITGAWRSESDWFSICSLGSGLSARRWRLTAECELSRLLFCLDHDDRNGNDGIFNCQDMRIWPWSRERRNQVWRSAEL